MNMRWRLNSCCEYRKSLRLLASGASPQTAEPSLRDHLAHCAQCRDYYEQIVSLGADFQQWASSEKPSDADPAFRARWMRSVQSADAQTPPSLAALISRWSDSLWPSPLAWGVLAAVWVCLLCLQWTAAPPTATGPERTASSRREVTFAKRQRELTSLLDTSS